MPFALVYIIKFSISLAVVFLFYQLVLRKLTFYNWNRFYLLGYTLFSFFVPCIDISGVFNQNKIVDNGMLEWMPVFQLTTANDINESGNGLTVWNTISLLILMGVMIMTIRLIIQLISFNKMMKNATIISQKGLSLYQINEKIIPFSFGNSVFINKNLHNEEELEEIIRHEMVHVKQHHSVDIIWSEILCLINWFNPFAWLIRKAIRQNLEFIADNKVLDNGVDRKQYQYLLLKVIGNNHFSIAPKFNFSSLKKRIAMMNKLKSTKVNLLRFLFVLPLLAVILVSFRKEIGDTLKGNSSSQTNISSVAIDTVPLVKTFSDKGYYIDIWKNKEKGSPMIIIRDKNKKEVKRLTIEEWNSRTDYYVSQYGELPPPPPPPASPTPPAPVDLPENVERININNGMATVWLKNGEKQKYDMAIPTQKTEFEKKYGKLPPPPPPPPVPPIRPSSASPVPPPPPPAPPAPTKSVKNVDASIEADGTVNAVGKLVGIRNSNGKEPLFILDGKIVGNDIINTLRPESIQSVDVLKEKSATSLYGKKGKDGVLIIKTKKNNNNSQNDLLPPPPPPPLPPPFFVSGQYEHSKKINNVNLTIIDKKKSSKTQIKEMFIDVSNKDFLKETQVFLNGSEIKSGEKLKDVNIKTINAQKIYNNSSGIFEKLIINVSE